MNEQSTEFRFQLNPSLIIFSIAAIFAYGLWEFQVPSHRYCGEDSRVCELLGVAVFVGWIAYINLVRARRSRFQMKYFLRGAFSGGVVPILVVVLLLVLESFAYGRLNIELGQFVNLFQMLSPVVLISGFYSVFASSGAVAIGQGISCLAFQLALQFFVSLPYMCTY